MKTNAQLSPVDCCTRNTAIGPHIQIRKFDGAPASLCDVILDETANPKRSPLAKRRAKVGATDLVRLQILGGRGWTRALLIAV